MTQQEILNMPNLKIAEVKPDMFVHVHAEDNYRITRWHEGDDIKDYSGSVCMFMPIRDEYDDNYRTITVEEHINLEEQARKAVEEEMKNKIENKYN